MSRITYRLQIDGLSTREEVEALRQRLETLNTVEVHELDLTTAVISCDDDKIDVNGLETALGKGGGAIVSMEVE